MYKKIFLFLVLFINSCKDTNNKTTIDQHYKNKFSKNKFNTSQKVSGIDNKKIKKKKKKGFFKKFKKNTKYQACLENVSKIWEIKTDNIEISIIKSENQKQSLDNSNILYKKELKFIDYINKTISKDKEKKINTIDEKESGKNQYNNNNAGAIIAGIMLSILFLGLLIGVPIAGMIILYKELKKFDIDIVIKFLELFYKGTSYYYKNIDINNSEFDLSKPVINDLYKELLKLDRSNEPILSNKADNLLSCKSLFMLAEYHLKEINFIIKFLTIFPEELKKYQNFIKNSPTLKKEDLVSKSTKQKNSKIKQILNKINIINKGKLKYYSVMLKKDLVNLNDSITDIFILNLFTDEMFLKNKEKLNADYLKKFIIQIALLKCKKNKFIRTHGKIFKEFIYTFYRFLKTIKQNNDLKKELKEKKLNYNINYENLDKDQKNRINDYIQIFEKNSKVNIANLDDYRILVKIFTNFDISYDMCLGKSIYLKDNDVDKFKLILHKNYYMNHPPA